MKYEESAGGVVFKKEQGNISIIICRPTNHTTWVFPKGRIGDHVAGEGKEETALREVKEESGAEGEILAELTPVTYWYNRDGEKRKKTVYYYLMEYVSGDLTEHDWEMEEVLWLPMEEIENRLSFNSDKAVWEEARTLLSTQKK